MITKGVTWDEVWKGDSLPELSMDIDLRRCVLGVAGTRDFFPAHYDADFARSMGNQDIFLNAMFFQGVIGRFMTDWTGPEGDIRSLEFAMREPTYRGDTLTVTGTVEGKRVGDGGERLVDLAIRAVNRRGVTVVAKGVVSLP